MGEEVYYSHERAVLGRDQVLLLDSRQNLHLDGVENPALELLQQLEQLVHAQLEVPDHPAVQHGDVDFGVLPRVQKLQELQRLLLVGLPQVVQHLLDELVEGRLVVLQVQV